MTKYKKGDVVLVLFPNSDLITAKRRPALVVQADDLNTDIEQVIVAMVTSNLCREGHPSRIRVDKDSDNKLTKVCPNVIRSIYMVPFLT